MLFRSAYYFEDIYEYDFHCIDWHWHPELEFMYVTKGIANIQLPDQNFNLMEGEAIFINSETLHRFESSHTAIIPNIVFSSHLLANPNTSLYQKFIEPFLLSSLQFQIFTNKRRSPEISSRSRRKSESFVPLPPATKTICPAPTRAHPISETVYSQIHYPLLK